jgi:hypothetical protein
MAMRSSNVRGGNGNGAGGNVGLFIPGLLTDAYPRRKKQRKAVEKASRDWFNLLTQMSNFEVMTEGYELPPGTTLKSSALIRIAVDDGDLDILLNRINGITMARILYRIRYGHRGFYAAAMYFTYLFNHFRFQLQIMRHPSILKNCAHLSSPLGVEGARKARVALAEAVLRARINAGGFALLATGAVVAALYYARKTKQTYVSFRVGAQAVEQAVRELWNADQEKVALDAVASAPVQTRVSNESFDAAKKMPSIEKVKYVLVTKFVTASLALGTAVVCKGREVQPAILAPAAAAAAAPDATLAPAAPPATATTSAGEVGPRGTSTPQDPEVAVTPEIFPTPPGASADGSLSAVMTAICAGRERPRGKGVQPSEAAQAAAYEAYVDALDKRAGAEEVAVQMTDCPTNAFRLLETRVVARTPKVLRDTVEVVVKSNAQLFEGRQKGQKLRIDDDDYKPREYNGVLAGPEVIEVIPALSSCLANELSGVDRHLSVLKHPFTGATVPQPSAEAEARMWQATKMMGIELNVCAKVRVSEISHFTPPKKWSEEMKATEPEKAEQDLQNNGVIARFRGRVLKGFTKCTEFMLPLNKDARLIGTLGGTANMEDCMSCCPVENLMKLCFKHLIFKGMNLSKTDKSIGHLLTDFRERDWFINSDDYSRMDAGWTVNDRKRVQYLVKQIVDPVMEHLELELRSYDHVLTTASLSHARQKTAQKVETIKWKLKYCTVILECCDSILFSGERKTSLGNRFLVMILNFSETIRIDGEKDGSWNILTQMQNYRAATKGDGDDDLNARRKSDYPNARARVEAYLVYHKILAPCSAYDETTDCEVLSRFHIWCGLAVGYIHIAKLERNFGRLLAFHVDRAHVPDDCMTTVLTDKELAGICTDIWQRVFSLASTLVVRHFARAMFDYIRGKMSDKSHTTVYDADIKRLGKIDGDKTLDECRREIHDTISQAPESAYAMVKVSHFMHFNDLSKPAVKLLIEQWTRADAALSVCVITDKHVARPTTFFEDFPIASSVARALGVKTGIIDAMRKQELPSAFMRVSGLLDPWLTADPSSGLHVGELADVSYLSSIGAAANTGGNAACESTDFPPDSPSGVIGAVDGAAMPSGGNPAVMTNLDSPGVQGEPRSESEPCDEGGPAVGPKGVLSPPGLPAPLQPVLERSTCVTYLQTALPFSDPSVMCREPTASGSGGGVGRGCLREGLLGQGVCVSERRGNSAVSNPGGEILEPSSSPKTPTLDETAAFSRAFRCIASAHTQSPIVEDPNQPHGGEQAVNLDGATKGTIAGAPKTPVPVPKKAPSKGRNWTVRNNNQPKAKPKSHKPGDAGSA